MNPSLSQDLKREEKIESILKEVTTCTALVEDKSLEEFADSLKQEKADKPLWELFINPQITCDWYIEGLDFCAPGWRHEFKRPVTPPPLPSERKRKHGGAITLASFTPRAKRLH